MKKIILLTFTFLQLNIWAIQVAAPKAPPSIPLLGMDIDLTLYQDVSTEGIPAIVRGRGDIYILPVNVGAKLYNKGADIKFLGATSEGLLSLLSSEAEDLGELESKKLYIGGQGSSPDVITRTIMEERGIEADILYRSSPEIAKLLITGRIQNAILPEPLATMVLAKNPNIQRVEELKDLWPGEAIPQVGIFVLGSSLETKEKEVIEFIEGYKEALESISTEDIERAIDEFNLKMSVEEFKSSLEYMNLTFERDRKSMDNYLKKLNIEVGDDFYAW
ncbi:hypothetical protein PM10SUCC1_22710 [Propionigenium maris DSM 9537]|uniref:NitT/TauT family transport system substrate-binding protein n=1 Tax=Propionigenium maris DSM 9537 TaxID=1123000 RepID=A0A9W6GNE6_9FUSO|nr:DUF3834 domain-containing protein [Propionigenium maris]GLI56757.1 hypothetical protein PM10SUCC1_22710 [Propionigenium maris DSM 9537]